MLGHHLRQWANIKPAFAKCLVYTGQDLTKSGGKSDEVPSGQVEKFGKKKTLNQCCFNTSRRWLNYKPSLAWCLLGVHVFSDWNAVR